MTLEDTLKEMTQVIQEHEQAAVVSAAAAKLTEEVRQEAYRLAATQGGLLMAPQCTVLLARVSGQQYDGKHSPIYKAIDRGLVEAQRTEGTPGRPGWLVEVQSFVEYVSRFKSRPRTSQGETSE